MSKRIQDLRTQIFSRLNSTPFDRDIREIITSYNARIEKLEAVAEAAKLWAIECREDIGHDKPNLTWLCQTLAALKEGGE